MSRREVRLMLALRPGNHNAKIADYVNINRINFNLISTWFE